MSHIEDRPTIAERYSTAVEASNLKVSADTRGPIDVIIAAGWSGDGIGATLVRLRAEFDNVRQSVKGTASSDTTERALVLMQMKSLDGAVRALGALAKLQAAHLGFTAPERDVFKIAGRALELYLDPLCPACDGRGFTGGGRLEHSGPQQLCRPCGGSGRRRNQIGKDDAERDFGKHLMALMERAASSAEARMGRLLYSSAARD